MTLTLTVTGDLVLPAQSLTGALQAEVTTWPRHSTHKYWIWIGILIGIVVLSAPRPHLRPGTDAPKGLWMKSSHSVCLSPREAVD